MYELYEFNIIIWYIYIYLYTTSTSTLLFNEFAIYNRINILR